MKRKNDERGQGELVAEVEQQCRDLKSHLKSFLGRKFYCIDIFKISSYFFLLAMQSVELMPQTQKLNYIEGLAKITNINQFLFCSI